MSWIRSYRRRCRLVFLAAWAYLRRGDEQLFDLQLAMLDAESPFARMAAACRVIQHAIVVRLMPALQTSIRAAVDFQEAMRRVQAAAEGKP